MGHATRDLDAHGPEEEVFVEPAVAHHHPEDSEASTSSQKGEVTDAVFGEVGADGPNYRSVSERLMYGTAINATGTDIKCRSVGSPQSFFC